jgi:hypothetical protein
VSGSGGTHLSHDLHEGEQALGIAVQEAIAANALLQ